MAAVVVAVKYFVPFPTQCATPFRIFNRHLPHMDWVKWNNSMGPVTLFRAARHLEPEVVDGEAPTNIEDGSFDSLVSSPIVDRGLDNETQCES